MNIETTHRIEITAPIERVWRETIDVAAWQDWSPTMSASRLEGGPPLGVGSTFILKQPFQAETTWRVTHLDPPALGVWRTEGSGPKMIATHKLMAKGSRCINVLSLRVEDQLALRLLRPMFWIALRTENRALKRRCEGEPN